MKKVSYLTSILLLVAIFVVIAAISEYFFFRVDLTEGGQYSLGKATKNILKNLDSPVTVTAYFTDELAPDLAKVKDNFRDMLIEYNSISGGNVVYKFVNPNKDDKTENEAMQAGIRPVLFNVRDKDEVKQQKIYMGAVIKFGNDKETLPFIDPKSSLEYTLSTSIKKLTVKNKPKIGFVQGQGEPSIGAYQQLMNELNVLYDVRPVPLTDTTTANDLSQYKTLVVVAPKDTFDIQKLNLLDRYLNNGGNLFMAIDHVEGDLQALQGKVVHTGLVGWLNRKGINIEDGFVVDASCGSISVSQRTNFGIMTSQMKFPYFPLISAFPDNPITKGLEQVFLSFTSPISYTGDTTMRFTPLATTSDQSGIQKLPVRFDINKKWTQSDFNSSKQIVAGLLEEKNKNGGLSRIVLVSNGDFAVNGTGDRPQQKQPDNISLMANSIDYLTDDTGLIDLRTKTITSRPIEQMSDARKAMLKWLNFLLPILLVIIYGLIRMQYRRNQRIKRMEEGYVK